MAYAHNSDHTSFQHKKSLGQNFLTSDVVPRWMCDAAHITTGHTVLEIGPGTGALTRELLKRGATVIAIETDERALAVLETKFADALQTKQLQLHNLDARALDIAALGLTDHAFSVIANIPYYLSGFLLRRILQNPIQPHTLVFLMQKEVVTRIARDSKESLLSLSVKAFGTPKYIKTVSKGHFHPQPKIDSSIRAVTAITFSHFASLAESEFFFHILHLGFGQKRKQLLSNLAKEYDRTVLTNIFIDCQLLLTVRAEDIAIETWGTLINRLKTIPKLSTAQH